MDKPFNLRLNEARHRNGILWTVRKTSSTRHPTADNRAMLGVRSDVLTALLTSHSFPILTSAIFNHSFGIASRLGLSIVHYIPSSVQVFGTKGTVLCTCLHRSDHHQPTWDPTSVNGSSPDDHLDMISLNQRTVSNSYTVPTSRTTVRGHVLPLQYAHLLVSEPHDPISAGGRTSPRNNGASKKCQARLTKVHFTPRTPYSGVTCCHVVNILTFCERTSGYRLAYRFPYRLAHRCP